MATENIQLGTSRVKITPDYKSLDLTHSLITTKKSIIAQYLMDKNNIPTLLDRASGTGGTHTYNQGVNTMTVTSTVGSYAITQSYQRHPYYPGVPMFIEMTFDRLQLQTGIIKEVGYFQGTQVAPHNTGYDGLFFESNGSLGAYNFCIANGNTGIINRIPQSSWNKDKLDGTGISGLTLDFSKFNVVVFEFLYLGGTAARIGFVIGDDIHWAHVYQHSNIATGTIFKSPILPIRWSIRNVGGTNTGTMGQICSTVCCLGEVSEIGSYKSAFDTVGLVASRTAFINANSVGTTYMLRAIRLNPTAVNSCILGVDCNVMCDTADSLWATLHLDPAVTGIGLAPATWESLSDSFVQYAYGDTITSAGSGSTTQLTSNGRGILALPVTAISRETNSKTLDYNRRPGISITGTPQILVLAVTPTNSGNNADVYGSLNFVEL